MLPQLFPKNLPEQLGMVVRDINSILDRVRSIDDKLGQPTPTEEKAVHFDVPNTGFQTSQDLRVTSFLVTSVGAVTISLYIGEGKLVFVLNVSPAVPLHVPLQKCEPVEISRGLRVYWTQVPIDVATSMHIWALPS